MTDDPPPPIAAEYRQRMEHARAAARSRYRAHLAAVFGRRGVANGDEMAEVALEALTAWRYIDSGERCGCSCHPRLPERDLHDYGFDCPCAQTHDQRRSAIRQWLTGIEQFWNSPEGQQIKAAEQAADAELQTWLADQAGVAVHSHSGYAPEQWEGVVDGHSFYFRERHGDWHIEVDLRPTGRFVRVRDTHQGEGTTGYRQDEIDEGDVIATGTTAAAGYGTTPTERAAFIVTTIRDHLTRQTCTHIPTNSIRSTPFSDHLPAGARHAGLACPPTDGVSHAGEMR